MVGSADFNDQAIAGQVNFTTSGIQPGSSMKPIAYAAAFEQGWHPSYVVMDVPTTWDVPGQEDYEPNNYSKLFYGAVDIRRALASSLNISAVKATEYAGVAGVMDIARRMGMITSLGEDPSWYGVALGLGSGEVQLLEHTNVFATFANNGRYVPITPLQRVEDTQGNILYETTRESTDKVASQAIAPGIAYQITSILSDNEARAPMFGDDNALSNAQRGVGRPTAAKSGTTENWRDLWTMGYTSALAVGVWVGRSGDGGGELLERDGTPAAGPIFGDLIRMVHETPAFAELLHGPDGQPLPEEFPVPDDVSRQRVDRVTGHRPGSGNTVEEWIVDGLEPQLAHNETSEWEREQLENALRQVDRGSQWSGDAERSVLRYANQVGARNAPIDDDDEDSSGSDTDTGGGNDSEEVPIEPIEPND
jgi:membrane peptidoglycan carboxypeptidase